ncbi:MAG TPA: adenylate/guanylate cyclase domain-containing protein [Micromonosporaceae bacterium]|nr:adenylate/guanylate cyclase domain-containing protein [Micromonosporaceae bacterium]
MNPDLQVDTGPPVGIDLPVGAAHRDGADLPSGQVTFLFTDIEASTRLAQVLGDGWRGVLHRHRTIVRDAIRRYGGAELLTQGDSFFVAFLDSSAALRACADAQRSIAEHPWPGIAQPRVRMGLHTGYAVPYGGEYASQEVHRASRVAQAAHGGQVLCSAATAARADQLPDAAWLLDLGLHRLRGFDDRERLHQLVAPGLERHFPRPRTVGQASHNLPASASSFVGRVPERAELRALIMSHRLVTVSGPGGVGKTRLAVEVARDLTVHYPDGVWFADLAATRDSALLPVSVASAFGLRPEPGRPVATTLAEDIRQHRCLLLLDTCEHQRSRIAALISQLLAACPLLTVVATSREPLSLAGEVVWRIPPMSLTVPRGGKYSDSVELLLDRARAARGGYLDASGSELPDLERVARRLDGLPLALELAAARLRVLSAGELAERLDDVLGVLDDPRDDQHGGAGPTRHSTLTTTVDWSYRTLGARSARLLRWMAAFAGPVDLDAIERLVGAPALPSLAVLVDKSLVQVEGGPGHTRYRMLDTIRAYAARKLTEFGETTEARTRHVGWCLETVRRTGADPNGVPVTRSMYPLDPLAEEVRRALHWEANDGGVRDGLRLVAALEQWWRERGLAREGRVWLFRLYQRMAEATVDVPDAVLAEAYRAHALLAGADGEHAEQVRFNQRAELLARREADPVLLIRVMSERGGILAGMGSPGTAERACRDTIRLARGHAADIEALPSVYCLARLLWQRGAFAEARELLATGAALEAGQPAWRGLRQASFQLGLIALSAGKPEAARCHLLQVIHARLRYGFHSGVVTVLYAMASWAVQVGDHHRAALLTGAADTHRDRLRVAGAHGPADDQSQTANALGDDYPDRYDAGARLDLAEAVRVAVAAPARPVSPPAVPCRS